MQYDIRLVDGYLKAEMRGRESADETREFVAAILDAVKAQQVSRVLISIKESRAIFKIEEWKFSEALEDALRIGGLKVAFISDAKDVRMSQEYITLVGRQRGLELEVFASEAEAAAWLQS